MAVCPSTRVGRVEVPAGAPRQDAHEILAKGAVECVVRSETDLEPLRDCLTTKIANAVLQSPGVIALGRGAAPVATGSGPTEPVVAGPAEAATPASVTPQPTAYALVVGIELYRDAPAATGAHADAERFAAVLVHTLGLRNEHIRLAIGERATKTDIESQLSWLKASVPAGGRLYFFFSGHGAPDAASGTPYLLPYDGNPAAVTDTALPLGEVMSRLSRARAKEVLAFVDSCFSGAGGRSVLPPGARPLVRVKDEAPAAQLALFTASGGTEISGPAPGENVGLFTKLVTEGLGTGAADGDGNGEISLQELADWVTPRVARAARQASREQNPRLVLGHGMGSAANVSVAWGYPTR
ncbi:MAG: caspase family protein [Deltaproteobacteria bacterium]|nr:caspase family protein [Deltaproteobacteria bacterium]